MEDDVAVRQGVVGLAEFDAEGFCERPLGRVDVDRDDFLSRIRTLERDISTEESGQI